MKLSDLNPDEIEVVSQPEPTKLSDLGDTDFEVVEPEKQISKLESFGRGARQGATMGFGEEIGAGIGAGLDVGQRILNELGLASPSPTQVAEQLKAKGITNAGPTSAQELYTQLRDEDRAAEAAAMKANPLTYGAGAITGGIATSPLMPTALTAPVQVAKTAGLGAKVAAGAASAIPTGLIAGAGTSEADLTQGDIQGLGEDILTGGLTGAAVGGILPVVGAGLSKVASGAKKAANAIIPEPTQRAYEKARQGISVTSPEFARETTEQSLKVVDDVANPILQKIEKQKIENAGKIAQLDDQITKLDDQAKQAVKLGEAKQLAQNADDIRAIDKETVGLAKNIQKRVFDVKKELGKQYDEIDNAAEATGVVPDNKAAISDFEQSLIHMSGLPENEVKSIMNKVTPPLGEKTIQGFRNTKRIFSNYFEHANPVVRKAAKQAYSSLKSQYANDLTEAGYGDIAKRLADTNKRWSAVNEMEEQFLSNLKPSRVTGEIEASPDTIRAISKAGSKNAIEMAETEQLGKLMNILDPEQAAKTMKQMETVAGKAAEAKAFKPNVPELPNPELARLQNLLAQAKKETPEVIPGLDVNVSNPKALKDELLRLLPKVGKTGDDVAQKRIDQIFDYVKKEQGPQAAEELKQQMGELSKDIELRNIVGRTDNEIPLTVGSVAQKMVGKTVGAGEFAGNMANKVSGVKKNLKDRILKDGVKTLSDATPDQLDNLSSGFANMGPEGAGYAKVLNEAKGKNVTSKNAIIFGLMQQPKFREMLRKLHGEEQETDNGETE